MREIAPAAKRCRSRSAAPSACSLICASAAKAARCCPKRASARSASCNATSTVWRYFATASSRADPACSIEASILPKSRKFHCSCGIARTEGLPTSKRSSNDVPPSPNIPMNDSLGNRAASATPIWAVAAARFRSAPRMSGRRATRPAGSPTATCSGGRGTSKSFCSASSEVPGTFPSRMASASSKTAVSASASASWDLSSSSSAFALPKGNSGKTPC